MYAQWASLQDEIQFDKANKSVLHKFPNQVGRDVACSVVKHIAQNLSINVSNCDPSNLESDMEVKWTMEVISIYYVTIAITNFLVSATCGIRFHDVVDLTVCMFTS